MEIENKHIALNIANTYMLSKVCSEEDFIEEYMELYFKVRNNTNLIGDIKLTEEDIYYLALNITNTYMSGKIGTKEDFIEEYIGLYFKVVSYNKFLFNETKLTEEVIHNLSMNIANTYMIGKNGSKQDFIEEYMECYNKAVSYNMKKREVNLERNVVGNNLYKLDENLEISFPSKRSR